MHGMAAAQDVNHCPVYSMPAACAQSHAFAMNAPQMNNPTRKQETPNTRKSEDIAGVSSEGVRWAEGGRASGRIPAPGDGGRLSLLPVGSARHEDGTRQASTSPGF